MQQLTGLDASFLALETTVSTGHVGGVCLLDPSTAPQPLDLASLTDLLAQRLPLVPVLRRRLLEVPFGLDQPYWVDDCDFDIEYHIREVALPRPGSDAQLAEQVCRLHSRPLDRRRPLWEMYLITGLADDRAAVYTKVHHSAIDGASGAELLTVLLDLSPDGRELPALSVFAPARLPSRAALAARAWARLAWRPVETVRLANELVRVLPTLAPALSPLVGGLLGLNRGDGGVIATTPGRAPATPFNKPITPHRRFAFRSVDLATVKAVKNAYGVSVNDVVMAMCAGALRRWLRDHQALPATPLVAMIPVSVRDEASRGALGNKVSAMLATLPTHVADPEQRLVIVHEATKMAKAQQAAIPQGLVEDISGFAPPALTARAARVVFATGVLHRLPPFNVCISNVPGPNVPVYLGGAKLLAHYPVSVITDGQGLNITLVGYLGQLHFGVVACRELVPDIDALTGYLVDELELLAQAAAARQQEPAARQAKPAAKPAARQAKPAAKPAARQAKPAAKPATKPAKPAAKPATKPAARQAK
jgi:diacylglycerol O-acyltransferase / wax synthase